MAGNLDTYALPRMKRYLGDTGSANDSTYMPFLQQAVYDVDEYLGLGMSVSVDGSSYTVSPDPGGDTEQLWNVIARCGVFLYREKLLQDFVSELEGMSSIRDEVQTMNRGPTMQVMKDLVEKAEIRYKAALVVYGVSVSTSACADALGVRESDP